MNECSRANGDLKNLELLNINSLSLQVCRTRPGTLEGWRATGPPHMKVATFLVKELALKKHTHFTKMKELFRKHICLQHDVWKGKPSNNPLRSCNHWPFLTWIWCWTYISWVVRECISPEIIVCLSYFLMWLLGNALEQEQKEM